ncbi:MAG: LamG-like jellyroll fold domain-containing protein [Candidatus Methanomethylicaceae archaeon]
MNEPQGLGRVTYYDLSGTVIAGAFEGSYARRFASSGSYVIVSNITYRVYPWTVMFYIRFDSASVDARLFYAAAATNNIKVTSTKINFSTANGATIYAEANVSLSINTWYHIAISCGASNNQWKIWLNGSPLSLTANNPAANLGQSSAGGTVYLLHLPTAGTGNVDLDHVKVYESQLSDAEVYEEMNKTTW